MTEQSNAKRFLNSFNRIDEVLRSRAKQTTHIPTFKEVVDASRELTNAQKKKMKDMADLRNAIVHTTLDGQEEILAEPRLSAVNWMETQADIIEKPPLVIATISMHEPKILSFDSEIHEFLAQVSPPQNFSQSPFRDASGELKLITTNAVARWVAQNYEGESGILAGPSTIGEVYGSSEFEDRLEIRAKSLKCVEAVRAFSGEVGVPPAAILITEPRGSEQVPIGMCTRADLPALYKSLGV